MNQYIHSEDKKALEVVEFQIISAEGTQKGKARGIFQEQPQPNQYSNKIVEVIFKKDKKFKEYSNDLSHINLLVFDTEYPFKLIPASDFYKHFFTPTVNDILYSTGFQEVFLITMFENSRKVYVPLKMLLLLASFHMFNQVLQDYPWETANINFQELIADTSTNKKMILFAEYLRAKTDKVLLNKKKETFEVLFGNSGLNFDSSHINIFDYKDYPFPQNSQQLDTTAMTSFFKSSNFKEKEQDIIGKYVFSAEIAFNINGDWDF